MKFTKGELRRFAGRFGPGLGLGVVGFAISTWPLVCSTALSGNLFDPEKAGEYGDYVGGVVGSLFAVLGVILIVTIERHNSYVEKFESKYFELIKLHRDNVSEIRLGPDTGRRVFVLLVRELREILKVAKDASIAVGSKLDNSELLVVSYYVLFFGVGPNSSRILKASLSGIEEKFVAELESRLNKSWLKKHVRCKRQFNFNPFEGHQSRLGHYYRHLFQTVKFVDSQKRLSPREKYEYVKTVRAQLSTHEQALLFLNACSTLGAPWWEDHFIDRYRMVTNLPPNFFDAATEVDISKIFGSAYFEDALAIYNQKQALSHWKNLRLSVAEQKLEQSWMARLSARAGSLLNCFSQKQVTHDNDSSV